MEGSISMQRSKGSKWTGNSGKPSTSQQPANTDAATAFAATGKAESSMGGGFNVHGASGYKWEREEDEPGYSWRNKKAMEEHHKAMDSIIDKDKMIGSLYGDIGLDDKSSGSGNA